MKPLKTCCMLNAIDPGVTAANRNTQDWLTHLNQWTSGMVTGRGYTRYVQALNQRGYGPVSAVTVDNTTDTITISAGHDYVNGSTVSFWGGVTQPGGLTAQTTYYVVNSAATTFQVSLTKGGAVYTGISSDGSSVYVSHSRAGAYRLSASGAGNYPSLQLIGQAILDFAALFDIAFFQDAPSESFLQAVKSRSKRGTKVGLYFANFEQVTQSPNNNAWLDTFDGVLTPTYMLLDTNPPTPAHDAASWPIPGVGACAGVSSTEATDYGATPEFATTCGGKDAGVGSKQTWLIDVGDATLKTGLWHIAIGLSLKARYPKGSLDYILIDNMIEARYAGTSTNYTGTTETDFNGGIISCLVNARDLLGARYGVLPGANGTGFGIVASGTTENNPTYFAPADIPIRYHEFFFHAGGVPADNSETEANIKSKLALVKKYRGMHLLGQSTRTAFANYHSGTRTSSEQWGYNTGTTQHANWRGPAGIYTWDALANYVQTNGINENVYIVNARVGLTTTGPGSFGVFYDETMGKV